MRGRALMVLHLPEPGQRDVEETLTIARLKSAVEPAYKDLEDKLVEQGAAVKSGGLKLSEAAETYFKAHGFKRERTRLDYEQGSRSSLPSLATSTSRLSPRSMAVTLRPIWAKQRPQHAAA